MIYAAWFNVGEGLAVPALRVRQLTNLMGSTTTGMFGYYYTKDFNLSSSKLGAVTSF